MPGMDGWEFLDALDQHAELTRPGALVVLTTSLNPDHHERAAAHPLVNAVLNKPLTVEGLEQVFYIFRRLHTAEAYPGTGIGLAHCQRIAQLHAGEIWAESTLGEGSTFHVTVSKFL